MFHRRWRVRRQAERQTTDLAAAQVILSRVGNLVSNLIIRGNEHVVRRVLSFHRLRRKFCAL